MQEDETPRVFFRIRQGRKVGRTLYRQLGSEPSDEDPLIGVVDTPAYAQLIVAAVNRYVGPET